MDFLSATVMLFLIMDPLGNIPVFNSILANLPEGQRRRTVLRELIIALVVLMLFLLAGQQFLTVLGLQQSSLSITGGVILFLIALNMVFPNKGVHIEEERDEPFIVPLAIPLIAGPSTIAALLLLAKSHPERLWKWTGALLLSWFLVALILLVSSRIMELIGRRGLRAVERLMGMLLAMIAVQMLLNGVKDYVANLAR
jgi:multiple antibiotic resistance protein